MDAYSEYENEFESVYGSENESEIEFLLSQLHVLVVGCGGLGNEILKNLVSFNVKRIDIMDPDVIEISNLHRQIFFRDKDIGRKKVDVIKEIIERKYKDVVITGHVNKVQNFGSLFFEQFDIILGCLDNIEGRAYINNIIFNLKKNVIYIDGGAEGFNGSIKIINRNSDNACLNCTLYNYTNRNIPICSIVNKPKTAKECILYVINHLSSESGNKKIEKNKDGREKEKEKKKKKKKEEEEEEEEEEENMNLDLLIIKDDASEKQDLHEIKGKYEEDQQEGFGEGGYKEEVEEEKEREKEEKNKKEKENLVVTTDYIFSVTQASKILRHIIPLCQQVDDNFELKLYMSVTKCVSKNKKDRDDLKTYLKSLLEDADFKTSRESCMEKIKIYGIQILFLNEIKNFLEQKKSLQDKLHAEINNVLKKNYVYDIRLRIFNLSPY